MRLSSVFHLTCAISLAATCAIAQEARPAGPSGGQDQAVDPSKQSIALTGCLQPAPEGRGFVFRAAAPVANQGAATGTSATGGAPSGQVTGQTPTGATATETAAPTPAVGTPPASANPASPGYNQPVPDRAGVSPADTNAQTGVTVYRLEPATGVNLREHAGHTVEIRGTVSAAAQGAPAVQGPTAQAHEPDGKPATSRATGTAGHRSNPTAADPSASSPVLMVVSVRHVSPTCGQ
jgi:hypothetical protein